MARVQIREAGLEYIQKMRFNGARDEKAVRNELARRFGRQRAGKLGRAVRLTGTDGRETDYVLKNESREAAMAVTGAYDADIIRKVCNWIVANREKFGEEILEIGCDIGQMTCFLAGIFPEKRIIAVDRRPEGIEIAKKNAEEKGLSNIEFIRADASELQGLRADTVFAMRVLSENYQGDPQEDPLADLRVLGEAHEPSLAEFARTLRGLLKEGGDLVSMECMPRNAKLFGYLRALTAAGLLVDVASYGETLITEAGREGTMQAMVFYPEDTEGVNPFKYFTYCSVKAVDPDFVRYRSWDAKLQYELKKSELIEGYYIEDTATGYREKLVVSKMRQDPEGMLLYIASTEETELIVYDLSMKDQILSRIHQEISDSSGRKTIKITKMERISD